MTTTIESYGSPEVYDGTSITMTFTFTTEAGAPADVSAVTVVILPGYVAANAVTLHLVDLTHVSTGIYTYVWPTLGITQPSGQPVECVVQAQATGMLAATTDPVYFTVLPPVVPILV
jgi:hypothetical protein